jgi:hypothetical protein
LKRLFETLDDRVPLDETGAVIAWRDGVPITTVKPFNSC